MKSTECFSDALLLIFVPQSDTGHLCKTVLFWILDEKVLSTLVSAGFPGYNQYQEERDEGLLFIFLKSSSYSKPEFPQTRAQHADTNCPKYLLDLWKGHNGGRGQNSTHDSHRLQDI